MAESSMDGVLKEGISGDCSNGCGKRNVTEDPVGDALSGKRQKQELSEEKETKKLKKSKIALIFGYLGAGYHGLQHQPGDVKTVERDLEEAIYRAGFISVANRGDLQKVGWSRCARTDKDVSAAANVIALRMQGVEAADICSSINSHLPPAIRVLGARSVVKGFNAKLRVDARIYEYLLPAFVLGPVSSDPPEVAFDLSWKPDQAALEYLRFLISLYKGTHNFHNFTVGKEPMDVSARRYIIEFECLPSFEVEGIQMIVLRVTGQSFMILQVRKMVGFVLALLKKYHRMDSQSLSACFVSAFSRSRYHIPTAPASGLLLGRCLFTTYDRNRGVTRGLINDPELIEAADNLKKELIFPHMVACERNEKLTAFWLTHMRDINPDLVFATSAEESAAVAAAEQNDND